jgi:hypothetical protein
VHAETATQPFAEILSPAELTALTAAATWYFKSHARIIAEEAADRSALALTRREDFLGLHSALWKLGVRLALPDELQPYRLV